MKKIPRYLLKKSFIALCISIVVIPGQSYATGLLDIYEKAKRYDPNILAAQARFRASSESRYQSRAALLPNISASIEKSRQESEVVESSNFLIPEDTREFDSSGWSINLRQSIYNHGNYVALKQAKLTVAQAETDYDAAQQELIIRTAEAYFNVLAALDNLIFATAEKRSVKTQLEQSQQRYDVGLIAITDVKESQAQYDLAVASEIEARNNLSTRREALRTITNEYPAELKLLSENMPLLSPEPEDIQAWVDTALQKNLGLLSSKFAETIAAKEVGRLRTQHYPSLDFVVNQQNSDSEGSTFGTGGSEQEDTTYSLQLNIPIYQGGRVSSQVREAAYNYEAAQQTYEAEKRSTIQRTRDAYLSVIADISRVKALKQALASTQAAYTATNAGFKVGTRNSVEVLQSLRETFRAQRDYAQARYDYILNTLRLKQAAGTLSVVDAEAIDKWLK